MTNKDFAGKTGFIWWTGIVEDRIDPLKLGRCRVRIVGWHSPIKEELPTDKLPWSQSIFPLNNPNPYAPKEGDMVFGFFMDSENAQTPVIMGVFSSIPITPADTSKGFSDPRTGELGEAPVKPYEESTNYPRVIDEPTTSRLARAEDEYPSEILASKKEKREEESEKAQEVEPDPFKYYKAVYPYNNVYESESGHALEFDDTKDAERIHLYHRSGSYIEWGPEGDKVERIQKDKFEVVIGDEKVYVKGDVKVYIDGDLNMEIGGTCTIKSEGKMTFEAPRIDLNP